MIPCEFHAPPRPLGASARIAAGPPSSSIRWSLPLAKNPSDRETGDQNGNCAPSVPVSSRATAESSGRTQSLGLPAEAATKATVRPSGEMALPPPAPRRNSVPGGGSILNWRGRSGIWGWLQNNQNATTATTADDAAI